MTVLASATVADQITHPDYREYVRLSDELYALVEDKWTPNKGYESITADEVGWISERIELLQEQVDRIMAQVWSQS